MVLALDQFVEICDRLDPQYQRTHRSAMGESLAQSPSGGQGVHLTPWGRTAGSEVFSSVRSLGYDI